MIALHRPSCSDQNSPRASICAMSTNEERRPFSLPLRQGGAILRTLGGRAGRLADSLSSAQGAPPRATLAGNPWPDDRAGVRNDGRGLADRDALNFRVGGKDRNSATRVFRNRE